MITGASGGIGLEFARIHAAAGGDLVLVARSTDKLHEIKSELEKAYGNFVHVISKDLSLADAVAEVYAELKTKKIAVDYLINNAGFGDFGMFYETDWSKELQMINLNITALTQLTKLFLQNMIAKGGGRILNVASTAAFQPGPTMAVYFATKAYVLHFSEAVDNEARSKGVTVTALCPGPTKSGFQNAADMQESKLFKSKNIPTSREVAEYGYKAMLQGKSVAVHGLMNAILVNSVRFIPRRLISKVVRTIQS